MRRNSAKIAMETIQSNASNVRMDLDLISQESATPAAPIAKVALHPLRRAPSAIKGTRSIKDLARKSSFSSCFVLSEGVPYLTTSRYFKNPKVAFFDFLVSSLYVVLRL